ncbi:Uncharacterised protein [uncultured Eubacterium sp.]|nr:Uncharacterised protein [uncultured Eubacterium sp.]
MAKKKKIIAFTLILLFCIMAFLILKLNKELNYYQEGFRIIGTYMDDNKENAHYLVFLEDSTEEKKEYSVYFYQQFGDLKKGSYVKSKASNIYFIQNSKGETKAIVNLDDNKLYLYYNRKLIPYVKFDDHGVFINVKK